MAAYDVTLIDPTMLLIWGYGGTGDITAPVLTVIDPAAGSAIRPNQAITFDVTDTIGLGLIIIYVIMGGVQEVIWDDQFSPTYSGSTRSAVTNGWRYVIRRNANWVSGPTFVVRAVDTSGNSI